MPLPSPIRLLDIGGLSVPVYAVETLIVGTGAAALSVAATLIETGYRDFLILNPMLKFVGAGASFCSGSDKQTLYKVGNFGSLPDSPYQFAQTLFAGGCMDGHEALIEGNYSLRAFYRLAHLGVSFPHTKNGAYVGYKTDHDPLARADSIGPRTSQTMVKKLAAYIQQQHPNCIMTGMEMVDLVVEPEGKAGGRVVRGIAALDVRRGDEEGQGLTLFQAENVVVATGGPGQLYRDSVLPRDLYGTHGMALRRGALGANFAEMQFGIGTGSGSDNFPWNLSGTYAQVIPDVYSTADAEGKGERRHFLWDWFESTPQMALAVFLKGYQWPFHAEKMSNHGSSLFDLACREEMRQGRSLWLDYGRNLAAPSDWEAFGIEGLPAEAQDYLVRNGAVQETPLLRLRHMNPLAIELYETNGIRMESRGEPIRFAVNYQHQNGGMRIDANGMSGVRNLFFNGEAAAAHGATRPGGAALNMGQTLGIHIAEFLVARKNLEKAEGTLPPAVPPAAADFPRELFQQAAAEVKARSLGYLAATARRATRAHPESRPLPNSREVIREVQKRMMEEAGFVVTPEGVTRALAEAKIQYEKIRQGGIALSDGHPGKQLRMCYVAEDMVLTQIAVLSTLAAYLERGGGSRGSRAVLDPAGEGRVLKKGLDLPAYRYRLGRAEHLEEILVLRFRPKTWDFEVVVEKRAPLPSAEAVNAPVFEVEWREHRRRMGL